MGSRDPNADVETEEGAPFLAHRLEAAQDLVDAAQVGTTPRAGRHGHLGNSLQAIKIDRSVFNLRSATGPITSG